MEMGTAQDPRVAALRRDMYALRNGIIADTLRKAGQPYKVIFGLQIPQLGQIARSVGFDAELADLLWSCTDTRECRLLAMYLYDPATISQVKIMELSRSLLTQEEADMLVFRLIKRLPDARNLYESLAASPDTDPRLLRALKAHFEE